MHDHQLAFNAHEPKRNRSCLSGRHGSVMPCGVHGVVVGARIDLDSEQQILGVGLRQFFG